MRTFGFLSILLCCLTLQALSQGVNARHDLVFKGLPTSWDEGIPLGNGLLGALVWQKGEKLRISLDRADLWDLRPVKEFARAEFRFSWVREQVLKKDYRPVQELFDLPYDRDPAPTKIPAAALEFDVTGLGAVHEVRLSLQDAICEVRWKSGATLKVFIHARDPVGWFWFENLPEGRMAPTWTLVPPPYHPPSGAQEEGTNVVDGADLRRLGYPQGVVRVSSKPSTPVWYTQPYYGGAIYRVGVLGKRQDAEAEGGVWSIWSNDTTPGTGAFLDRRSREEDLASHRTWWKSYWSKSSVTLPDTVLEAQWYREMYKFGSASRRGAPPITLQAVWTADNGKLPPWKGDYHSDLNTQLSYWPCYSGNHLEEGLSFLDWLWDTRAEAMKYTKLYFGTSGLDYPGVATLTGEPMGGWIQYSLSPTVSAWLAHHFYMHWRYSMDTAFLKERGYPWIRAVAVHLDELSLRGKDGLRMLPLSSSPEINDNSLEAWFLQTTNYDLALIRWLYGAAAEMAGALGDTSDAKRWRTVLGEWPELSRSPEDGKLLVAPGYPLKESHRHFSHLMAIHPLGLLDPENGQSDTRTIRASLADLERLGPSYWCGYSYSWLGSMYARALEGEKAARALRTFATCFCLPNSFHVNGDQSGTGKSKFTYRPFTLEGNFAFAEGIQEMLLQSHNHLMRIFPAVPDAWKDVSFSTLRAEGAYLVSAVRKGGTTREVRIFPEVGGTLRMKNPFGSRPFTADGISEKDVYIQDTVLVLGTQKNHEIILRTKVE